MGEHQALSVASGKAPQVTASMKRLRATRQTTEGTLGYQTANKLKEEKRVPEPVNDIETPTVGIY